MQLPATPRQTTRLLPPTILRAMAWCHPPHWISALLTILTGGCSTTDTANAITAHAATASATASATAAAGAEAAPTRIAPEVLRVHAGRTFAYVIAAAGDTVIIDAGDDRQGTQLVAALASVGRKPGDVAAVLLTHGHADVRAATAVFPAATVYVSAEDFGLLRRDRQPHAVAAKLLNRFAGRTTPPALTRLAAAGELLRFGGVEIEVIGTPGHTIGSLTYRYRDILFTGDSVHVRAAGLSLPPWYLSDNPRENEHSFSRLRLIPFALVADAAGGFTAQGAALYSQWRAARR